MTEEGEEAGNGESLVTVADDFKVDSVVVEDVGDKGDGGVDGHHEEDADDTVSGLDISDQTFSNIAKKDSITYCFCSHGLR